MDFDSGTLHAIPQLAHLRWHGARRNSLLQTTIRMCQTQQIIKMYSYPISGSGALSLLLSQALRLVKDIRIVPIDKNAIHMDSDRLRSLVEFYIKDTVQWLVNCCPVGQTG